VYVAGDFSTIKGQPRPGVAALRSQGAAVGGWAPAVTGVRALAVSPDNARVYLGGDALVATDLAGNQVWSHAGKVQTVAVSGEGSTVFAGGEFTSLGGQPRSHVAAVDAATGTIDAGWRPETNGSGVAALTVSEDGSIMYMGGDFTSVRGHARNRLAALNAATGTVEAWDPNVKDGSVVALSASGSQVYVGGTFTNLGARPVTMAAAIDTGTGLPIAGHFSSALDGNPVRNAWMSAANLSGLAAARMASAGIARNTGTAAGSLGDLLGALDAEALVDDLGERWDVELGYFKRHASCSFTHPAADAVLELRHRLRDDVHEIRTIEVETHALAVGLDRTTWSERLAAMFSTPFVVAAALVHGQVDPSVSDKEARDDPAVRDLAAKVTMRQAPDLDARLPHERAARVRVQTPSATLVAETPNPVGDSAHHPLSYDDVVALLRRLLSDPSAVTVVEEVVDAMPAAGDVTASLQRLAGV
ncbi:MAG: hypothetical protein ACRDO0_19425, partial [Nocardioidaceae bacterium]